MKSLRILDRRIGSVGASVVMLLGILVPGLVPMAVSAATLSSRSIAMSNSASSATSVEYTISFTTIAAAKGFSVDFCTTTPFEEDACTLPTGLNVSGGSITVPTNGVGSLTTTGTSAAHLEIQGGTVQSGAGATVIKVTGVANPTSTGVIYARIYSYTGAFTYTSVTDVGTYTDFGGVAMDITTSIGVTAAVREKLIFCVSGSAPTASCAATDSPSLTLGEGSPKALDSSAVSTGSNYSQISTNASGGAVVNIKNSNVCGGLHRTSQTDASICEIAPDGITASAIAAGQAKFGVQLGTTDTLSGGSGTIAKDANYSTDYGMGWVSGNATGVSSTYGDPLYTTSGAPANNINVPMTFAASISNDTPAGIYTATINLIATGTF